MCYHSKNIVCKYLSILYQNNIWINILFIFKKLAKQIINDERERERENR